MLEESGGSKTPKPPLSLACRLSAIGHRFGEEPLGNFSLISLNTCSGIYNRNLCGCYPFNGSCPPLNPGTGLMVHPMSILFRVEDSHLCRNKYEIKSSISSTNFI